MAQGVHRWFALLLMGAVLCIGAMCLTDTTEGKTITVDDDGGANFTRVQDAIDSASDGDIIRILPGTYHETIRVNKSVCLEGNGSDETILDGSGFPAVVVMDAEGACIRNCTITGAGIENGGIGILVERNRVQIIDNHIGGYRGEGVRLRQSEECMIRGNTIRTNAGQGIKFFNADDSIIEKNAISDAAKGIDGSSSRNIEIRDNTFTNCTIGIEVIDAHDFRVEDNQFAEYSEGITINEDDRREVVLKGNTFDGSGRDIRYWDYEICTGGPSEDMTAALVILWIAPIGGVLAVRKVLSRKRMKLSNSVAFHYIFIVGWTALCLWLYIYTW